MRFDPAAGTLTQVHARLPSSRGATSAIWTGEAALIFGGSSSGSGQHSEILSYSPEADNVTVVGHLPFARDWTSAVWVATDPACSQGCAYVIGGGRPRPDIDEIVRFDPASGVATVVAKLPRILWGSSAFLDTRPAPDCPVGCVYIVGGSSVPPGATTASVRERTEVLRFDPASRGVVSIAELPEAQADAGVIWDGAQAWLFGGHQNKPPAYFGHVLNIDPLGEEIVRPTCMRLPVARAYHAAVWTGHEGYLFGGVTAAAHGDPVILRFNPKAPCLLGIVPVVALPIQIHVAPQEVAQVILAGVGVQFQADVLPIDATGDLQVATDPSMLAMPVPPVPGTVVGQYVQLEAATPADARIRIEIVASERLVEEQVPLAVHYYDGQGWTDLSTVSEGGLVPGNGEADLQVFSAGFDELTGTAWVEVSHLSTYALAPASNPKIGSSSEDPSASNSAPMPVWFWPVLGVGGLILIVALASVLVLVISRKTRSGRKR